MNHLLVLEGNRRRYVRQVDILVSAAHGAKRAWIETVVWQTRMSQSKYMDPSHLAAINSYLTKRDIPRWVDIEKVAPNTEVRFYHLAN